MRKDMFLKAQDQNDWNGVNTVKVLVGDVLFPYLKVGVIDQNVEKNDQSITHSFRCGTQDHIKNIRRRSRRSEKNKKVTFRILFERISMVEASERMKIENLV